MIAREFRNCFRGLIGLGGTENKNYDPNYTVSIYSLDGTISISVIGLGKNESVVLSLSELKIRTDVYKYASNLLHNLQKRGISSKGLNILMKHVGYGRIVAEFESANCKREVIDFIK